MWRKVEVMGSETLGEELDDNLDRGLDIDAETMHQRFLADLPPVSYTHLTLPTILLV